jgi:hypothetical protein
VLSGRLCRLACVAFGAVALIAVLPSAAFGVILAPTTVDGPSPQILEFGGVAIASDGTGGLVYTKSVEGVPHVFVARYVDNSWGTPIRVDAGQRFEATEPRIAADRKGRLLVVWVTPVATVHGTVRKALMSAILGPGSEGFSPSLIVDPNVGNGVGVTPSVAGASAGKAIVAYRVVTEDFTKAKPTAVQLRPGDVLADIRLARFNGSGWSKLGAVNRNPAASMRPPSETNGPQVGIGATGNAVVVWQEPDQTGVTRIWARRVFASSIGPPVEASPPTWDGEPVGGEADAFSLGVTQFDQARIVSRVESSGAAPARLFLGTFEPNFEEGGPKLVGPQLLPTPSAPLGPPAVAAGGLGGGEGKMRIAYPAGESIQLFGVDGRGGAAPLGALAGPQPIPTSTVAATVGSEGGGVTAYETIDQNGLPAVAIRQEFPDGTAQSGVVIGAAEGVVSRLSAAATEEGDALIGFRQGEAGSFEIVGDRVSAPPATFGLRLPKKWVKPRRAVLGWEPAPTSVGGVTYSVVVDGQVLGRQLTRLRFRPRPALLGAGIRRVRVIATDALGGQVVSRPAKLRVDDEPPSARLRTRGLKVSILLADQDSGVKRASCSFGDGSKRIRRRRVCRHAYRRPGRYPVLVREADRAGNSIVRHLEVVAR